ncbi:MAG: amidohydrolase [Thermaerobacter sp.]|nr:amidohydrolase [Thermaerobacter sp.]
MLVIQDGEFHTVTGGVVRGSLLVKDGRIAALGRVEIPPEAEVLEAGGRPVYPGFIDAHTHLGLYEEGEGWAGDDVNETGEPVTPHLRAIDGINPADAGFTDALRGGVTAAWVAPGSANVLGGEGVTLRTAGREVAQMVLRAPWGLKGALGENPKRVHGDQKRVPSTRIGTAGMLRETLVRAQGYLEKVRAGGDKTPERDLRLEAVGRVLRGEYPLRLHAHRADDILTGVRIAEEFGIRICIEHCTEGHQVAQELARRGIPAVVGPSLAARVKAELRDRSFRTPAVLSRAGVKVALMTDHPVVPSAFLPLAAALAVREGMTEEEALRAVTIHAAEICGVGDRLGSLEAGKDADLVVWSGPPFDLRSRPLAVLVAGRVVHRQEGF